MLFLGFFLMPRQGLLPRSCKPHSSSRNIIVSGQPIWQNWTRSVAQGVVMTIESVAFRVGRQSLGCGSLKNNYTNVGC